MRNTGVIIKKIKPTDYIAGKETGIIYEEINLLGNWVGFLPSNEYQFGNFDTMACVTFSALNCIETQVNFMVEKGLIPQGKLQQLKDWGFFDESGKFNCSDRFTAKMSGTTPSGNILTNVWDSIRKDGLVPEKMWAFPRTSFSWDNYYQEIPQEIKDFAKKILSILKFEYEWIYLEQCGNPPLDLIRQALKQAPVQIATPVCPGWSSGNVIPCGTCRTDHATMIYRIDNAVNDFDHYEPFTKRLALTYTIPYCLKGVVSLVKEIQEPSPIFHYAFFIDLQYGQKNDDIKALQKVLKSLGLFPTNIQETGYYGEWTRKSVLAFQIKYINLSLYERYVLIGKKVGPKTRLALNNLFNQ